MTGKSLWARVLGPAVVAGALVVAAAPARAEDPKPAKKDAMSVEDTNKAKFRMFFDEVVNQKNMERLDEYVGKTIVDHQEAPGYGKDYAGVKKYFTDVLAAFPDLKVTVDQVMADGDLVAALCTWTGTNKVAFMGAPASGKPVTFTSMEMVRIKDGKAVEHWGVSDNLALMTQLGAVHMHH